MRLSAGVILRFGVVAAVIALGLPWSGATTAPDVVADRPAAAAAADAPGRWTRAESEHFVIYSDRSEALVRRYVAMLEDFDRVLRLLHNRTDAETPRKLPVYLVSSTSQMQRVVPGAHENLRGFYATPLEDIFVVAIREDAGRYDRTSGDDTVLHEYTHHFMMQYFPNAYPGWLVEGFAEYYMTADLQPEKVLIGDFSRGRARSLLNQSWVPMDQILSKHPGQVSESDRAVFYAQSWLLTHYIWSDKARRGKLNGYLKAVREGEDPMAAWTRIYGDDAKTLQRTLDAYMNRSLTGMVLKREPPAPPQIVFTPMPAGADDLILEVQQLKRDVPDKAAPAFLAKVRKLAAKRPAEFYSRRVMARAECDLGDRTTCETILATLLQERPKDMEALQLMAASRLSRARQAMREGAPREQTQALFADAAKYLGQIHKLDENDYMALYGFAQTKSFDAAPAENTLNVIFRAAEIAPQVSIIRMNAARLFIQARQYDVASQLMAAVAGNPHGGARAKYAGELMDELADETDGEPLVGAPLCKAFAAAPPRW